MHKMFTVFILTSYFFTSAIATAADFYIDPFSGHINNDGSAGSPWSTLQDVFENNLIETRTISETPYAEGVGYTIRNPGAPVKAGDTIYLRSGYHGEVFYRGAYNTAMITIKAQTGHTPTLRRLQLSAAENWTISGLTFTPDAAVSYTNPGTIVFLESHGWHGPSSHIIVENNTIYSVSDTSAWSAADWDTLAATAINCHAGNSMIRNNNIANINFGIIASGNNTLVENNSIVNFCGDGIRGAANDLTLQYNTIKNCYDVNDNHDDGIQFYNGDADCANAVMRGNVIINFEDINQPHRGTLQGIGCFDGPYINFTVENNLVIVDHWHGISLYDAQQSRIINNTVYECNPGAPGPPWIRISGTDNIVLNNLSSSYALGGEYYGAGMNLTVDDPGAYFTGYLNLDYSLCQGSPAINSGTHEFAPNIDLLKNIRPAGSLWDMGAYEYNSTAVSQLQTLDNIYAYPNPAKNDCTIKFEPGEKRTVTITFYNTAGERIHQTKQDVDEARFLVRINISSWAPGLYIYTIEDSGKLIKGKLAVSK